MSYERPSDISIGGARTNAGTWTPEQGRMPYRIDPVRPPETDEEPWSVPPLVPDRPSAVIGFLLAGASGFIVGLLVMWAAR